MSFILSSGLVKAKTSANLISTYIQHAEDIPLVHQLWDSHLSKLNSQLFYRQLGTPEDASLIGEKEKNLGKSGILRLCKDYTVIHVPV